MVSELAQYVFAKGERTRPRRAALARAAIALLDLERGRVLLRERDPCEGVYVVARGTVRFAPPDGIDPVLRFGPSAHLTMRIGTIVVRHGHTEDRSARSDSDVCRTGSGRP